MVSTSEWRIAAARQPKADDYRYDLDEALTSVVGLRAIAPDHAFTAEALGTERAGSGVVIRPGVVLTIGYLITEAEEVWITAGDGRTLPGHPLAYDQVTGFGLVQALGSLDLPSRPLGRSAQAEPGTPVVIGGAGGKRHSVAGFIVGKQEFAGYWEYVLDEAIFAAPAHPFWGGTALLGPDGDVLGVGSLQVEQRSESGDGAQLNMVVPIDLLHPILDDCLTKGRVDRAPRPWLGVFSTEMDSKVFVVGLSTGAPAEEAGLHPGDLIVSVAGTPVSTLAGFFRCVWALGDAGVDVPLTIYRDNRSIELSVTSGDRDQFLKAPRMHS